MLPDWLPWLLQVNDSQFPSGAYAHSMGLEELTQQEVVRKPEDLEKFLHEQIIPSLKAFELPFLARARAAAVAEDLQQLRALDDELEAWKLAAELRAASRQLGSRRMAMARKLDDSPILETYASSDAPCHHLVICAIELRLLPAGAAGCAFALQTLSGYAVASMKLIRMGQERCQLIIRRAIATLAPEIEKAMIIDEAAHLGWFNPLLEIASMRHARAHERLFIS
ncbi:MAG: urease accessory protein UreF [Verrucomicrobium sp.]